MTCLTCRNWSIASLCEACAARLEVAPDRTVDGHRVIAGLEHRGPARILVHRLKYEAMLEAARVLAPLLSRQIDYPVDAVTYVPRVLARRWRYGIDQSRELAGAVAAELAVPMIRSLEAQWWSPPSAGAPAASRRPPGFSIRTRSPMRAGRLLVVDDVLTTGATLRGAAQKLREEFRIDVRLAVATSATEVTSLRSRR
jgi:predicted amidophosphoribosyltransferase